MADHLRGRPGYGFCTHCLARELGVAPRFIREGMWRLEPHEAFGIRTQQCVSCLLTKRVIRYDEVPKEPDTARRVIEFLVEASGFAYCATCVAFAVDVALADAKRLLGYLEPVDQFHRKEAPCAACARWQPVFGFAGGENPDAAELAALSDALAGHVRYRGFRIDLLSFRTSEGWRPFALIKSSTGALTPDVPAIVMDLTAAKFEADDVAAARAREWIDKRFP